MDIEEDNRSGSKNNCYIPADFFDSDGFLPLLMKEEVVEVKINAKKKHKDSNYPLLISSVICCTGI